MTQNAIDVLTFILAWGWRFLTGYYIPGTNVTPGAMLFFILLASLVINFFRRLFNVTVASHGLPEKAQNNKGD